MIILFLLVFHFLRDLLSYLKDLIPEKKIQATNKLVIDKALIEIFFEEKLTNYLVSN